MSIWGSPWQGDGTISGELDYQGTWNANTNTPSLTSSTGTKNHYYIVSVAGSTELDGITNWNPMDWAIFNGVTWQQIDNSDLVTSVFGRTGAVVAATNDYTWAQINKATSSIADITTRSHTSLTDIGTNTHAQIDTHIAKLQNNIDITKEPTGFSDPDNVIVTYNTTNRTITLTGGASVKAYFKGIDVSTVDGTFVSGWTSAAHSAGQTATVYLYWNGSAFVWSNTIWTFDMLQIAAVVFSAAGTYLLTLKECHGLMNWNTHQELHNTIGTYKKSGGTLGDYVLSSTTAANRRPSITETVIYDEDLKSTLTNLAAGGKYQQFYLAGAGAAATFVTDADDIIPLSTNQPYYNQFTGGAWQQTLFTNNHYGAIFVIALPTDAETTSAKRRFVFIQPQQTSLTLSVIQALTFANVNLGEFANLTPEFVPIAKIIIQYTAANWVLTSVESISGTRVSSSQTPNVLPTSYIQTFNIFGNGFAIATGLVDGAMMISESGVISQVTILSDVSTSSVVDIWKDTYANYPPTVADTITASAKPTITTATKNQDSTLTGWTTTVTQGDILYFNVDSNNNAKRLTISLKITRTS